MPLPDKVEAIKNIAVSTTKKQWRSFIGLLNNYRDIFKHMTYTAVGSAKYGQLLIAK